MLLAAGGVIAGLVLTGDSILQWAPPILTILIVGFLIGSVILSLSSFATRHYETGPDAADLAARMQHLGDAGLQQLAIPPLLEAIDINDSKVNQKAALLSYSGICLMLGTFFISLYYLYSVMDS